MAQSNFCHGCTQHQLRIFILFSSYNGYEIEPTHTKMQSNSAQTHLEIISLQRGSLVSALLQLPLGSTTSKLAVTSCYTWPYPTQCTELHTAEAKTGSGNSRLISTPHSESAHEVFSPSSAGIETTQIRISNLTKKYGRCYCTQQGSKYSPRGFIRSQLPAVNHCLRCLPQLVTKPHIQESM